MAKKISEDLLNQVGIANYHDIRPTLATGDFLFCSGNYPVSRIIREFTNSVWSHVGTIVVLKDIDRIFVLESTEDIGVRFIPLSNYFENYFKGAPYDGKLAIGKAVGSDLSQGIDWAIERIGRHYDHDEIVKIIARIITGRGKLQQDNEFTCAELVASIWRIAGKSLTADSRGFHSPESIWRNDAVASFTRLL